MKIAEVQINMWEKPSSFLTGELSLQIGDYVIIEISGVKEIGKIINLKEISDDQYKTLQAEQEEQITPIVRQANLKDLEKLEITEKNKKHEMKTCQNLIDRNKLPMKLVDVQTSFDEKKMTFAFIAEGRVDFRNLVKDLTREFQRNIRLQQLGVRDEAKINGDIGACGIVQCCKTHLKDLGNVNAEQAENQQVSHRGAERLSGICNRLKCCLRYENELYIELAEKLPAVGNIIRTSKGKGEVINVNILKQTVDVKLEKEEGAIIEIPVNELK